jgi:phosphatidylglycerophosphatase A
MTTPTTTIDKLAVFIASAGGAGFMPKAPGTAGAAVGVLLYLGIEWLQLGAYYLHVIILLLVAGIWASFQVEKLYGHDSQRIVMDEVVGQMITFAYAAGRFRLPVLYVLVGFGLFRLFDIFKPFPVRRLEHLKGGVGVMADDVGAGIYALIVLSVLQWATS